MSMTTRSRLLACALALALPATGLAQSLPQGEPAALGFSPARLATMEATLERYVADGRHAGVIWLVARRGEVVSLGAHGLRDVEAGLPMETDTICRIYSMSKIPTSVAALILLEEGRFDLQDPISRYLPELQQMQVMTGGTAKEPLLATASGPITIEHLFTHTSGLYYGFSGGKELETLIEQAELWGGGSLEAFVKRAAKLPLKHQPGEAYTYGISTDVLGRLVEVVSGQRLGEFMQERIFAPLGMVDTAFFVPEAKRSRLAKVYQIKEGQLVEAEGNPADEEGGLESGGGGLFSTIGDYSRFAQMLLDGGELEGQRILGRKTVELMTSDRLAQLAVPHIGNPGAGFGLGVSVLKDLGQSPTPGSLGRYGWSGAATTDCAIDAREQTIGIVFAQHFPFNEHRLFERFTTGYLQALVD